jgi:hypothetical protein
MRKKPLDATVATTGIFYETFFFSFATYIKVQLRGWDLNPHAVEISLINPVFSELLETTGNGMLFFN